MFKKLKSLFVVEEEEGIEEKLEKLTQAEQEPPVESKKETTNSPVAEPTITIEQEVFDSNISGPAKPQKKFTDILLKAIENQNLDGPDYLEFKSSLKSLETVIEDEETRFKSSYAVLKSTGISKDKLLSSGGHYIKVLEQEKKKFESTFQDQQNKQVAVREQKIKTFQDGIQKRKEQLQKLITEIETMEKKLDEAKIEINQAAGKVQLTKDQFMASYRLILGQIESDFDKIKQYL